MTTKLALLLANRTEPDWQIALACGIHPSQLSRYRSGERTMTNRHAARLAEFFGVSPDDVRSS